MGIISDYFHLKVNLKRKLYLNINYTTQRCRNKIIKTFLVEDFFHLPSVPMTQVVHIELRNGPNWILRGIGETDSLKTPEVKISWHCPFKCRCGREYHWECEGFRFRESLKYPSPQKTQENTNHFLKEWRDSSGLGQLVYTNCTLHFLTFFLQEYGVTAWEPS